MQHAWNRRIIALVASLTAVGAVAVASAASGGSDEDAATSSGAGPFLDGTGTVVAVPDGSTPRLEPVSSLSTAAPATPEAAIEAFFAAEIADDFSTSFALLSEDDRRAVGNAGEWAAAHDELPIFEQFVAHGPPSIDGDTAVVEGTALMTPVVDATVGIFPAEADASIVTVGEDGGWRVAFSDSVLRPVLPDDGTVADAAEAWVERRRSCDDSAEAYAGPMLGDPRIPGALCGTTDRFVVDDTGDIDDVPDASAFLAAFGPDGVALLRSVSFDGPRSLTIVLAPLGADWVVVGAE